MDDYPQATVACFDPTCGDLPRRALDVPRFHQFLQKFSSLNLPGVLIAASTGHGHLRRKEELQEFFAAATDVEHGDTKLLALLRPEDGLDFCRDLLQQLKASGYEVAFFRPGTDLSPMASTEQMVAHLQPFVRAAADVGLPVGLYSISDVSGMPLTAAAVAQLVCGDGGDSIVAVKVTEADFESSTLSFLQHPRLQHLHIVQGWDPHLARAFQTPRLSHTSARVGLTSGPMSLAVFQYLHLLDAARRDDWEEVAQAQSAVNLLFAAMQDDPTKFADLQRAKYIMGLGHPIVSEVTTAQVQRVLDALRQLPRAADRHRLASSLDLMQDGPFHQQLQTMIDS